MSNIKQNTNKNNFLKSALNKSSIKPIINLKLNNKKHKENVPFINITKNLYNRSFATSNQNLYNNINNNNLLKNKNYSNLSSFEDRNSRKNNNSNNSNLIKSINLDNDIIDNNSLYIKSMLLNKHNNTNNLKNKSNNNSINKQSNIYKNESKSIRPRSSVFNYNYSKTNEFNNSFKLEKRNSSIISLLNNDIINYNTCENKKCPNIKLLNNKDKQYIKIKREYINQENINKLLLKNYEMCLSKYKCLLKKNQILTDNLNTKESQLANIQGLKEINTIMNKVISVLNIDLSSNKNNYNDNINKDDIVLLKNDKCLNKSLNQNSVVNSKLDNEKLKSKLKKVLLKNRHSNIDINTDKLYKVNANVRTINKFNSLLNLIDKNIINNNNSIDDKINNQSNLKFGKFKRSKTITKIVKNTRNLSFVEDKNKLNDIIEYNNNKNKLFKESNSIDIKNLTNKNLDNKNINTKLNRCKSMLNYKRSSQYKRDTVNDKSINFNIKCENVCSFTYFSYNNYSDFKAISRANYISTNTNNKFENEIIYDNINNNSLTANSTNNKESFEISVRKCTNTKKKLEDKNHSLSSFKNKTKSCKVLEFSKYNKRHSLNRFNLEGNINNLTYDFNSSKNINNNNNMSKRTSINNVMSTDKKCKSTYKLNNRFNINSNNNILNLKSTNNICKYSKKNDAENNIIPSLLNKSTSNNLNYIDNNNNLILYSKRKKPKFITIARDLNKSENYYYKIKEIYNNNFINNKLYKKYKFTKNDSILSLSESSIIGLINNPLMTYMFEICKSDHTFIENITNANEQTLINYCDMIAKLISDYRTCMSLIIRIKKFLRLSVNINSSLILEDAIKHILLNATTVLDCERGNIYLYDSVSDKLVIHKGEGYLFYKKTYEADNKKNVNDKMCKYKEESSYNKPFIKMLKDSNYKVSKTKGLIGYCYINNIRLNINDPYKDDRFNEDHNFKNKEYIRNLLYCPLRRTDNSVIGVVEVINKKGKEGSFNKDDEELIEIISFQLSSYIQQNLSYDDKLAFVSRIKQVNEFRLNLIHTKVFNNTNNNCYISHLLNCISTLFIGLYSSYNCQLFLCNYSFKNTYDLYLIKENNVLKVNDRLGIIEHVISTKNLCLFDSIYLSEYYNSLIDLEAYQPILTFPVYDTDLNKEPATSDSKLLAVVQTVFPYKKLSNTTDLANNDEYIIAEVSSIISNYISFYSDKINFNFI